MKVVNKLQKTLIMRKSFLDNAGDFMNMALLILKYRDCLKEELVNYLMKVAT